MTPAPPDSRHGRRAAAIGLLVNAVLGVVKLAAGVLGRSDALVADAVESIADIFGSVVIWSGLRIAELPADRDHPYGHGKAEPLAAMLVALILFVAAISIAYHAIDDIRHPQTMPAAFTLPVLLGVVAVKEILFRRVRRIGLAADSAAVMIDAWHHRSDAITSAAAAVGIAVALVGGKGWEAADDWAALLASGVIFFNAHRIARIPLAELMDAQPTEVIARVRAIAETVPGVLGVEKVFARKSGTRYWVDMHVEVEPTMSVRAAHGVAHAVKDALRQGMPSVQDALIHVEPFEGRNIDA